MKTINIPDNTSQEIKIQENESIELNVGKSSRVKVIDISESDVNILIGENSKVEYITIKKSGEGKKFANVGKNASIKWVECYFGERIKAEIRTELRGEDSETKTFSVIFGDKNDEFDIKNEVIHAASRSKSNMLTRVVLNGKAKGNYNGLVRVNPNAYGCEGYQKKETILLSEDAHIDAVPNLEIENNDVKCSHGATMSQIDGEKLFYFMSRGVNESLAKRTIIEGFFDPILSLVDDNLKEEIKKEIIQRVEAIK